MDRLNQNLAIIGCGNIGTAIARGLVESGSFLPSKIILTRRRLQHIEEYKKQGFQIQSDNHDAIRRSSIIIIAVEPQQLVNLLNEIKDDINPEHVLISVVSG